jgi:hypothetical protein
MEREILELRRQIANVNAASSLKSQLTTSKPDTSTIATPLSNGQLYQTPSGLSADQYIGSHEAVASLLDLRSGYDGSTYLRSGSHQFKRIEDVMVATDRVTEIFNLSVIGLICYTTIKTNRPSASSPSTIHSFRSSTERRHPRSTTHHPRCCSG